MGYVCSLTLAATATLRANWTNTCPAAPFSIARPLGEKKLVFSFLFFFRYVGGMLGLRIRTATRTPEYFHSSPFFFSNYFSAQLCEDRRNFIKVIR